MNPLFSPICKLSFLAFLIVSQQAIYAQSVVVYPKSTAPEYIIKYEKFWQMYEFHPDYAKITSFNKMTVEGEGEVIIPGFTSMYEAKDVYNLTTGDSVEIVKQSKERDRWRGVSYEVLKLELKPDRELKKGESFSYWISYMTKRLPHLHTTETIKPEVVLHLGINARREATGKSYKIVALPSGTEIDSTFHFLPTKKVETEDWIFFIYDISDIKENVNLHIKFALIDDSPQLKIEDVQEILKDTN